MSSKIFPIYNGNWLSLVKRSFKWLLLLLGVILYVAPFVFWTPLKEIFLYLVVKNQNIPEIYWITVTALLTLFIPLAIESIQAMRVNYKKFGPKAYLRRVVRPYDLLFLLSITAIFSTISLSINGTNWSEDYSIVAHLICFSLWLLLFGFILKVIVDTIHLIADSGDSLNELNILYDEVADIRTENDIVLLKDEWSAIWESFESLADSFRTKFLRMLWIKLNRFIFLRKYNLATILLSDFSTKFLNLENNKELRFNQTWANSRKPWFWFHDKEFSDKTENLYAVFSRLLELYSQIFREHRTILTKTTVDAYTSGLDQLNRFIDNTIELLVSNELDASDDGFYGLFRQLKNHIAQYIKTAEEDEVLYLQSLPIYIPVFEHADKYSLSQEHGFPAEWRLSIENVENLFGKNGDARMRLIWFSHFLDWSSRRISHGKKDFDNKLDGAIEMLFPKMHNPWIALWLGFRNLSWGGDRIDSLCKWNRNFGFSSYSGESYWYDQNKSEEENEREMLARDEALKIQSKKNTAKVLMKLKVFGTIDDVKNLKKVLQSLEGRYQDSRSAELNRLELMELTNFMLETK